eukprot:50114-Hanusia_phi.AAC.6
MSWNFGSLSMRTVMFGELPPRKHAHLQHTREDTPKTDTAAFKQRRGGGNVRDEAKPNAADVLSLEAESAAVDQVEAPVARADVESAAEDEDEDEQPTARQDKHDNLTETDRLLKLAAAESLKEGLIDPELEASKSQTASSGGAAADLTMRQVDETSASHFIPSSAPVVDMQEVPKNRPRTSSS